MSFLESLSQLSLFFSCFSLGVSFKPAAKLSFFFCVLSALSFLSPLYFYSFSSQCASLSHRPSLSSQLLSTHSCVRRVLYKYIFPYILSILPLYYDSRPFLYIESLHYGMRARVCVHSLHLTLNHPIPLTRNPLSSWCSWTGGNWVTQPYWLSRTWSALPRNLTHVLSLSPAPSLSLSLPSAGICN